MTEFAGRRVVVTGGAKGIGRGICEAFAAQGASVLCLDIDERAGENLARSSKGISFFRADVSRSAECEAARGKAVSALGGIDVLCNNAGIQPPESYVPAHQLPDALWDRIIAVNLKSCFLMAKHCIPALRRRGGGVIVNIASVQGHQSMKGVAAYAASKGGILALTRQLALEYAADNIRVLAVSPGTVDTPMTRGELEGMSPDEEARAWNAMARAHPLGRVGRPADIADLVLFLASDRASFMTGAGIDCDGGLMAQGAWADAEEGDGAPGMLPLE